MIYVSVTLKERQEAQVAQTQWKLKHFKPLSEKYDKLLKSDFQRKEIFKNLRFSRNETLLICSLLLLRWRV